MAGSFWDEGMTGTRRLLSQCSASESTVWPGMGPIAVGYVPGMGVLDTVKDWFDEGKAKLQDTVATHADSIKGGIDKASSVVGDKTGGKYSDKVTTAQEKGKGLVDGLAGGKPSDVSGATDGADGGGPAGDRPAEPGAPPSASASGAAPPAWGAGEPPPSAAGDPPAWGSDQPPSAAGEPPSAPPV